MVLARFFAWLDRVLRTEPSPRTGSGFLSPPGGLFPAMATPRRPARRAMPQAALLSVDGGGQFLLLGGERFSLGHLRSGQADLGFLADVGSLHAWLVRSDSLHTGPGWSIEPCEGESVMVEDVPVAPEGRRLASGERVRLGENLEFRMGLPDPASASAVLELLHGAECAGARHILLLAAGPGGRVRIGANASFHVPVPGLDFELFLEWSEGEVRVYSAPPFEIAGEGGPQRVTFAPRERIELTAGVARGSRPPFSISFEPVIRP